MKFSECPKALFRMTPVIIINKDNNNNLPYFKTDMMGIGAFKTTTHTVLDLDNKFFALSSSFDLTALSNKAVYVYHNGTQMIHDVDYVFSQGFVQVTKTVALDDTIVINELETTNKLPHQQSAALRAPFCQEFFSLFYICL